MEKFKCPLAFRSPIVSSAFAIIEGGSDYPGIRGCVFFTPMAEGTLVTASVYGLPAWKAAPDGGQPVGPFGFHIHEHGECSESSGDDPFHSAGGHWNPDGHPHGNHAGDMPVLFSANGYSYLSFYTNRFKVHDIIGKAVIIHENPDDFRTQPAGNSGKRIACGVIRPNWRSLN